jgi:hypothetical protein
MFQSRCRDTCKEKQMEPDKFDSAVTDLVNAVRDIFEAEAAKDAAKAPQLNRALALMQELRPHADQSEAVQLPVCRHFSRALDLGEAGPAAAVAKALRELEPAVRWAQNPRYTAENRGAEFMDNYGWSESGLTGPGDLSFGILMLGPGTTYPPTSYESEGIFLVIGGSPEWKSGDEPWVRVDDGSIICRPWNGAEGKRAGDEPMLALYAWMYQQP